MQFLFEKNHFTLDSHLNHRDLNAQSTDSFEAIIFMAFKCLSISYTLAIISYIQYILLFFSFVPEKDFNIFKANHSSYFPILITTIFFFFFFWDLSLCFMPSVSCSFNIAVTSGSQISS